VNIDDIELLKVTCIPVFECSHRELGDDFESEVFRYLPKLFVPIHIIVSVILASMITIGFEEPIRKKIKQWIENRQKSKNDYQPSHRVYLDHRPSKVHPF